jgi:hypothetical protein
MGRCNDDENGWVWLEDEVKDDFKLSTLPNSKTLMAIMEEYFEEALAISYINHSIIVELKEVTLEQHKERLDSLPHRVAEVDAGLRYHNGPILRLEVKDLKQGDTARVDGSFDPTVMLSRISDTLISVGIRVLREPGTGTRVAIHCWDSRDQAFHTLALPQEN